MTYPQQPYQPPQPGYPAQPPPYAPQQPAPQYEPQPGYPVQPPPYQQPQQQGYAPPPQQQGYAPPPQPQPQYAPQQPQYEQPPPPQPPVLAGPAPTLRDFMDQPAGGGNTLSFAQVGTRYVGTVIRTITNADVQPQTEMNDPTKIAKYNDGRVKYVMKVPVLLDAPTPQYPDGTAIWFVKGNDRNELMRAMEAAGAQNDPELGFYRVAAGDRIDITYTHDQPGKRGMNPMKVKRVAYAVGNGVPPELPTAAPQQPAYQGQAYYDPNPQAMQQYQQQPAPVQYAQPAPPQQPVFQQPAFQDPNTAYTQATGQQMQLPPGYQQAAPQYAQQGPVPGGYPTPAQHVPAGPPSAPVQPAAAAFPSSAQGAPPPGWPADVPFIPGLTPDMARIAAQVGHPAAQQ